VIAAMNLIDYDAATLGNHDFSFGLPFLEQALSGARFPVVCANAVRALGPEPLSDRPFCPPALILERKLTAVCGQVAPIRIGVFGVLPPQVAIWEGTQIAGQIQTRDILTAARAWVGHLRDCGADLIIALCHSGIGASEANEGMENAAVPLAALEGIDVVIAGHIHRPFPDREYAPSPVIDGVRGSLCQKPAVMAGFWGSHLGQIDLKLAIREGRWTIRSHRARALPIARRTAKGRLLPLAENDPVMAAAVEPVHRAVLAQVRQPIGRTDIALHSYFARLCDCAAMQLIHAAQLAWLDDWAKESPLAGLPRISAASPFKSGGRGGPLNFTDIAAGDLERRHVNDLYTFPNAIRVVMVTGQIVGDWLERSASQFLRLEAGILDQPLFDADWPSYNFDSLSGISYEIDATRPARYNALGELADQTATRVRNVRHNGRKLMPDMRFLVVTNSFRAAGGGQFAGLGPHVTIAEPLTPN
jgi:2',3'-cyclic-nucleotide 2'-phosphodiesterase/3'-nucleotidase